MAFPGVPADTSDGSYLSAAWLNQLADCAAYLQGVGEPSNTGFFERYTTTNVSWVYRFRHRHRYLKVRYTQAGSSADVDFVKVSYGGTYVYNNSSPDAASAATLVIDLNNTGLITPTPTVGAWYSVAIEVDFHNNTAWALEYLCEQSDTAAL
jgi:hypothetical protein